jgi:hypothetical protein
MKVYRWSPDKNEFIRRERGLSFERVVVAVDSGSLLDVIEHPNKTKYPNQNILVVSIENYVYLVPFVEEENCYFLKTVIPSRKATRDYLQKGEPNVQS